MEVQCIGRGGVSKLYQEKRSVVGRVQYKTICGPLVPMVPQHTEHSLE